MMSFAEHGGKASVAGEHPYMLWYTSLIFKD